MRISTNQGEHILKGRPDSCPFCHRSIIPGALYGYKYSKSLEVFMYCPNTDCNKTFVAYYAVNPGVSNAYYIDRTSQGKILGKVFADKIQEISSSFITIYNQAYVSEQQGLTEICGVGYRKALEFLIKDYTILHNTTEKEKIEQMFLGKVIEQYIADTRIKSVAKRAAWLGNDETHYIRKWEGKNLEDLKKLIDLTVHWIEMEVLTLSFEIEMPE